MARHRVVSPRALPIAARRPAPFRREPAPEAGRAGRRARLHRWARPDAAPLGHARAPLRRPAPRRSRRPAVRPVPRRADRRRRRGGARARRAGPRALAPCDGRGARPGSTRPRPVARRSRARRGRRAHRDRAHRARARRSAPGARGASAAARGDRRRASLHLHREPVLHRAVRGRGAARAARRTRWPRDRPGAARALLGLDRAEHHGPLARRPGALAARGGPLQAPARAGPSGGRAARRSTSTRSSASSTDTFLKIGSANLSARSMAMDSECDLVLESGDRPDLRRRSAGCAPGSWRSTWAFPRRSSRRRSGWRAGRWSRRSTRSRAASEGSCRSPAASGPQEATGCARCRSIPRTPLPISAPAAKRGGLAAIGALLCAAGALLWLRRARD